MSWVILFFIAVMVLSALAGCYFLVTKKYDRYTDEQLAKARTLVLCSSITGYAFSTYVLYNLIQHHALASWLQALAILLMWFVASASLYHSQRYILSTLSAALMTLSSASYFAYAKYGLDMPLEFAIAMGVAVSSLFTAMILFLGSQQQISEH